MAEAPASLHIELEDRMKADSECVFTLQCVNQSDDDALRLEALLLRPSWDLNSTISIDQQKTVKPQQSVTTQLSIEIPKHLGGEQGFEIGAKITVVAEADASERNDCVDTRTETVWKSSIQRWSVSSTAPRTQSGIQRPTAVICESGTVEVDQTISKLVNQYGFDTRLINSYEQVAAAVDEQSPPPAVVIGVIGENTPRSKTRVAYSAATYVAKKKKTGSILLGPDAIVEDKPPGVTIRLTAGSLNSRSIERVLGTHLLGFRALAREDQIASFFERVKGAVKTTPEQLLNSFTNSLIISGTTVVANVAIDQLPDDLVAEVLHAAASGDIKKLVALYESAKAEVRAEALEALEELYEPFSMSNKFAEADAIEGAYELLDDPQARVRANAASLIATTAWPINLDRDADAVAERLLDIATTNNPPASSEAVAALGTLVAGGSIPFGSNQVSDERVQEITTCIQECLQAPDDPRHEAGIRAIRNVARESRLPDQVENWLIEEEVPDVLWDTAVRNNTLASIEAITAIGELYKEVEWDSFSNLTEDPAEVTFVQSHANDLAELLGHEDARVRATTCETIDKIYTNVGHELLVNAGIRPKLVSEFEARENAVQEAALNAYEKFAESYKSTADVEPDLREVARLLKQHSSKRRVNGLKALSSLLAEEPSVGTRLGIPERLVELLRDGSPLEIQLALECIQQIVREDPKVFDGSQIVKHLDPGDTLNYSSRVEDSVGLLVSYNGIIDELSRENPAQLTEREFLSDYVSAIDDPDWPFGFENIKILRDIAGADPKAVLQAEAIESCLNWVDGKVSGSTRNLSPFCNLLYTLTKHSPRAVATTTAPSVLVAIIEQREGKTANSAIATIATLAEFSAQVVSQAGAIPVLVHYCSTEEDGTDPEIRGMQRRNAYLALGNIADEQPSELLTKSVINVVLQGVSDEEEGVRISATHIIASLCDVTPKRVAASGAPSVLITAIINDEGQSAVNASIALERLCGAYPHRIVRTRGEEDNSFLYGLAVLEKRGGEAGQIAKQLLREYNQDYPRYVRRARRLV